MPILAFSPTRDPRASSGFSLIEVIVVLVLLSLVTSVVIPNLSSTIDRFQLRSSKDEVLIQLSGLGYLAYQKQQAIVLYPEDDLGDVLELPEGWTIEIESPIRYQANGICLGGTITLVYKQAAKKFLLTAPFCRPESISDA
jgi:general secretion pathway protein G